MTAVAGPLCHLARRAAVLAVPGCAATAPWICALFPASVCHLTILSACPCPCWRVKTAGFRFRSLSRDSFNLSCNRKSETGNPPPTARCAGSISTSRLRLNPCRDYSGKCVRSATEGGGAEACIGPLLVWPMAMPSLSNSPWIWGAPEWVLTADSSDQISNLVGNARPVSKRRSNAWISRESRAIDLPAVVMSLGSASIAGSCSA